MQQQMSSGVGAVPRESVLVYMPVPIRSTTYDRYQHKQSIGLGITHVIIGILCIIFNIVCIAVNTYDSYNMGFVGHGFWCGTLVSFGIQTEVRLYLCLKICY